MLIYLLSTILLILGLVGVGKLINTAISRPRQLGSGQTPQLPSPSINRGGSHRVVQVHGGTPLAAVLREHANAAELAGLRPFLELGAVWCPPSRMFGEILDDPRMARALSGIYLIRAELDDFSNDPKARELRAVAIPVFFELDANGEWTGRRVDGGAWGADTVENMSQTMAQFFGGGLRG